MADHRISRSKVQGADEFDRLQTLHESAASCLDGRLGELPPGLRALTVLFAFVGEVDNGGFAACMYIAALDEQFYALPSIEPLLSAYVDRHPDEFFTD